MVIVPILVFLDWKKTFHVHVYASSIALGIILAQPGEGGIDHPIAFASRKLSSVESNYTTIEREGLTMVYALQKFRHYLLGSHFKMFTDHSTIKYLVNKPVLEGKICRWLLLFQEYDFEIIVKQGRLNAGLIIYLGWSQVRSLSVWKIVYLTRSYFLYRLLMIILKISFIS